MPTAIKIPDIGTTVDQVKLVKWLKKEGDSVKRGDALCEVETDKAVSELESIAEGTLLKILVAEDTEVVQESIIAYVGIPGEEVPEESSESAADTEVGPPVPSSGGADSVPSARVPPMLRNLAKKEGVDLTTVVGTGPGGRTTREDIIKAKARGTTAAGRPMDENQVVVARRVSRSQRDIPPIHLTGRFDMSAVTAQRKTLREESGSKVSFDAFFIRAAARVMREFPHFRSRLEGETVLESESVTVGIALGVGTALFTPAIEGADTQSLEELAAIVNALQAKAEAGSFASGELRGATLTVSNLGMYPVQAFSAVIPPDQIAILSIGAVEETPVVDSGKLSIVPTAHVTLSVDHRLINGREAAEFLSALKGAMESP